MSASGTGKKERLAKVLAHAGIASRRQCEVYIQKGRVTVNGERIEIVGTTVDPQADVICFDRKRITLESKVYYVLHKPAGYTTTARDRFAKQSVFRLLPKALSATNAKQEATRTRVFSVGRLDRESTGLLLFTNDGDLAHKLTHPRYGIEKQYKVRLNAPLKVSDQKRLLKGIQLEEGLAKAEAVRVLKKGEVVLTLREGKKREIRRMFQALGYEVESLHRFQLGSLKLGDLASGKGRFLNPAEVKALSKSVA